MTRNQSIDFVRGLLILLVVVGHWFEVLAQENAFTWLVSGFRMPLFIGLAGFLFNLEKARSGTLADLYLKYRDRLILPWLVACIFYLFAGASPVSLLTPVEIILRAPFHLWFVPALGLFFLLAYAIRLNRGQMALLFLPISVAAMLLYPSGQDRAQYGALIPDRRYFIFAFYFFFGMFMARHALPPRMRGILFGLCLAGFFWWHHLYTHSSAPAEIIAKLMMILLLIALLPWAVSSGFSVRAINFLGRDSLFFYLWHPLAFALLLALGLSGLPMLAVALALLVLGHRLIASLPLVCAMTGLVPTASSKQPRLRVPCAKTSAAGTQNG